MCILNWWRIPSLTLDDQTTEIWSYIHLYWNILIKKNDWKLNWKYACIPINSIVYIFDFDKISIKLLQMGLEWKRFHKPNLNIKNSMVHMPYGKSNANLIKTYCSANNRQKIRRELFKTYLGKFPWTKARQALRFTQKVQVFFLHWRTSTTERLFCKLDSMLNKKISFNTALAISNLIISESYIFRQVKWFTSSPKLLSEPKIIRYQTL